MPAKNELVFDDLLEVVRKHTPKAKVTPKRLSKYMRAVGVILGIVGVKGFMENFWTTIFYTIYQPGTDIVDKNQWRSIPHEGIHTKQAKKYTPLFFSMGFLLGTLACLVPAILFSWIFFIWVNWWSGLIFIGGFVLISFPPFGFMRANSEFSAYGLSIAQEHWMGRRIDIDGDLFKFWMSQFTGSNYQWMWPFKGSVKSKLSRYLEGAKTGEIFYMNSYGQYYLDIYKVLDKHGLVKNTPDKLPS